MLEGYQSGHKAEKVVSDFLIASGFKIVALNYKTRSYEIDIIAEKNKTMYFIEVKYRKNNLHGSGLEYITASKKKQMQYAAEAWASDNNWNGGMGLAVIEVCGPSYIVGELVEL